MKIILPVAGKGERMRPYTNNLPKCLLPVGSKTIICGEAYRATSPVLESQGSGEREPQLLMGYAYGWIKPEAVCSQHYVCL